MTLYLVGLFKTLRCFFNCVWIWNGVLSVVFFIVLLFLFTLLLWNLWWIRIWFLRLHIWVLLALTTYASYTLQVCYSFLVFRDSVILSFKFSFSRDNHIFQYCNLTLFIFKFFVKFIHFTWFYLSQPVFKVFASANQLFNFAFQLSNVFISWYFIMLFLFDNCYVIIFTIIFNLCFLLFDNSFKLILELYQPLHILLHLLYMIISSCNLAFHISKLTLKILYCTLHWITICHCLL